MSSDGRGKGHVWLPDPACAFPLHWHELRVPPPRVASTQFNPHCAATLNNQWESLVRRHGYEPSPAYRRPTRGGANAIGPYLTLITFLLSSQWPAYSTDPFNTTVCSFWRRRNRPPLPDGAVKKKELRGGGGGERVYSRGFIKDTAPPPPTLSRDDSRWIHFIQSALHKRWREAACPPRNRADDIHAASIFADAHDWTAQRTRGDGSCQSDVPPPPRTQHAAVFHCKSWNVGVC